MSRYELKFARDGKHEARTVRFDGEDASLALILAHREAADRSAELWRDDKKICTIRRHSVDNSEVWVIGRPAGH